MTDEDFSDLVEECNSPAAKRIEQLERELAEAREHYRMSSVCRKMKEQRDDLSGHYHRLNAENVILQQQRDRLAEALLELWHNHTLHGAAYELIEKALAAVKGGTP
jgi:hypothetical protein